MTFIVVPYTKNKNKMHKKVEKTQGDVENKRRPCCGQPQSYYLNVHCSKNRQLAVVGRLLLLPHPEYETPSLTLTISHSNSIP